MGVALLALLVTVAVDAGVGLYDIATDPGTRIGGISAPPREVASGPNTFTWLQPHPSGGIEFALVGRRISQADLDSLTRGVTGSLHVRRKTPEGGTTILWEYVFRLDPQSTLQLPSVERFAGLGQGDSPVDMSLGIRYDVTCALSPTDDTRVAAQAFHAAELAAREPYEFSLVLDGTIPEGTELLTTYSKPPRSFLRNTLLGRASAALTPR